MAKPDDRGSLMNLKANLTKVAPIEATEEMERRIMGRAPHVNVVQPEIDKGVRKDVSTAESPIQSRSGNSRRQGTILLNAKIPVSLHTRLKRTSQYNDVSMTEILLRGLESELESGRYCVPPETWGTDQVQ